MGLLSFVSTGLSNVKQTFTTITANTLSTVGVSNNFVTNNKSSFTSPLPLAAKIAEHPFATAGLIGTGVIASGYAVTTGGITASQGATAALTSAGKSVVAKAIAKPGQAAVVALVGTTVLKSEKATTAVLKTPSALNNFTSNAANLIDNPSLSSASKLAKENPVITSLLGLGTLAAVGGGLGLGANTVATYLNSKATNKNTLSTLTPDNVSSSPGSSTNKFDTKVEKAESKQVLDTNNANIEIAKINAAAALAVAKEQTAQASILVAKNQIAAMPVSNTTSGMAVSTSRKKKKKAKKAKSKPKKKKKAKNIKKKKKKKKK
jgi:hypothetical protein